MKNADYLTTFVINNLHYVRLLDDLHGINDEYVFVVLAYLRSVDQLAKQNNTEAEIYKIDYCPATGIPTCHTSFLGYVRDKDFDVIADRVYFELTCASMKTLHCN